VSRPSACLTRTDLLRRLGRAMSVSSQSYLTFFNYLLLMPFLQSSLVILPRALTHVVNVLISYLLLSAPLRTCVTSMCTIPFPSNRNARLWRTSLTRFLLASLAMAGSMSRKPLTL
jgi:hypothetical protein